MVVEYHQVYQKILIIIDIYYIIFIEQLNELEFHHYNLKKISLIQLIQHIKMDLIVFLIIKFLMYLILLKEHKYVINFDHIHQ